MLTRIVAEVAGEEVAAANAKEKSKTMKGIVCDHLAGENGRAKVEKWVPRWMTFPPSAYTARGGIGTVKAFARMGATAPDESEGAAIEADDLPDPAAPAAASEAPEADEEPEVEQPMAIAAE